MEKNLTTFITEAIEAMSIESMVNIIKNSIDSCDDATKKFIYHKVISNTLKEPITEFLSTKYHINGKVNNDIIEDIIDHAVKFGDIEKLADLCTSKRLISFDKLINGNNIKSIINSLGYGFSDNFIDWLIKYTPKNQGKGMGNFEILLQMFVEGGHLSSKGDVGVNNLEIEMKAKNARLTGQGHWGNGTSVSEIFINTLKKSKYYGELKSYLDIIENDLNCQLYYIDLKKNPKGSAFYDLVDASKKDENMYDEVLNAYCEGLSKLYKKLTASQIRAMLISIDTFNKKGKVEPRKIIDTCAALDLYYYATIEKFDYIGFFGGDTKATTDKYALIDGNVIRNSFKSTYDLTSTILSCSCPNTKPLATPQDSFSQINIK